MSVPSNTGLTGSYSFAPAAADLVLYAFSLINIRRTELTTQHYADAALAANFAMVNLANHLPMRFALETQIVALTAATATYSLASRTIAVPIVTIATSNGTERTIGPISAYDYQALPTKATTGAPTSYFFSLLKTPTLTFWPVPDASSTYTANVQTFRQLQDVDLTNMKGVDSPYRFLDALATEIAARLADSYQPAKAADLYAKAANRLQLALARDEETTNMSISPSLGSYYRVL